MYCKCPYHSAVVGGLFYHRRLQDRAGMHNAQPKILRQESGHFVI